MRGDSVSRAQPAGGRGEGQSQPFPIETDAGTGGSRTQRDGNALITNCGGWGLAIAESAILMSVLFGSKMPAIPLYPWVERFVYARLVSNESACVVMTLLRLCRAWFKFRSLPGKPAAPLKTCTWVFSGLVSTHEPWTGFESKLLSKASSASSTDARRWTFTCRIAASSLCGICSHIRDNGHSRRKHSIPVRWEAP